MMQAKAIAAADVVRHTRTQSDLNTTVHNHNSRTLILSRLPPLWLCQDENMGKPQTLAPGLVSQRQASRETGQSLQNFGLNEPDPLVSDPNDVDALQAIFDDRPRPFYEHRLAAYASRAEPAQQLKMFCHASKRSEGRVNSDT